MVVRRLYERVVKKLLNLAQTDIVVNSPLLSWVDRKALLPPKELLRLGTAYGGWIIPTNCGLSGDSVCYSAGAGEDISFDCALVQRCHCQVRVIDPTPRAIQHFDKLEKAVKFGERFPINNSHKDYYTITNEDVGRLRFLPIGLADKDA